MLAAGGRTMSPSVRPSGLEVEMSVNPVWPPPPALLTIWTGWPSSFSRKGAMTRAATSLLPPAAHATIMLTGRLGFQVAAVVGAVIAVAVALGASVGAVVALGASVALGATVGGTAVGGT